ncbi:sensor histidine kinase [Cryptosporangium aurantiacum]|uniref:Histidine kinase-, DNA gyrase B-, and HSP90-like ATPase n=1 Tax=Cryptosporangium aurantiacum TaxID=134849 RepID=A0A1M7RMW7_9ACTN|nr:sensor histidine kinase [Cryptosporangium aurantiacum]SHN47675.1 Histidine kinase-, DNA gyrase B-, and HSP90-like ATPase [Cryptosporangium aurantiacum]
MRSERTRADRRLYQLLFPLLMLWYVFVVAGVVAVLATWGSRPLSSVGEIPWWSHAIATVVVVATWAPVSAQIERGVHQLAFGQRDNTYDVAGRVYRQLQSDPRPDELLPSVAALLADTLALPYVEIEAEGSVVTTHGAVPDGAAVVTIPLTYYHLTLGTLRVSGRRRRDSLSAADVRLLEDLARHVAITLHAAGLTAAVQHSREQLVTAREEERLRIRRDLHDGLGPTLASLGLQLGVLQRTLRADPAAAETLAAELRGDVRQATAEIRRLVYELRPPMLDEFGLVDALRNLNPTDGPPRSVSVPDPLPTLPAAVEVAIYRIAAESLHNAARHAGATRCAIELTVSDDEVTFTVTDDGCGLPENYLAGVGHRSMRERSTELGGTIDIGPAPGGGTRVAVTFPMRTHG